MATVLIISNSMPYPPDNGERIRIYNLIKELSKKHNIHLVSFCPDKETPNIIALKPYCVAINTVQLKKRSILRHLWGSLVSIILWRPLGCHFFYFKTMKDCIEKLMQINTFDVVQVENSIMASYYSVLKKYPGTLRILDLHNFGYQQFYQMFKRERNGIQKIKNYLDWIPMKSWESRCLKKYDKCIVMSKVDEDKFRMLYKNAHLDIVPNGVDVNRIHFAKRKNVWNVLFIGKMDYGPNVDAVLYFEKEILPIVRKRFSNVRFVIVGGNPPKIIKNLSRKHFIDVTGYVDNVQKYYNDALLSVVPLRAGSGTRLKILEAMATGCPIVSTSLGCEGIDVVNGEHICIADNVENFAYSIIQLLEDVNLRDEMCINARLLVEKKYSWEKIASTLSAIYDNQKKKS